jgi:hypothetical protein
MPAGSEGTGRKGAIPDPEVDALDAYLVELGESRGRPTSVAKLRVLLHCGLVMVQK